MGVDTRAPGLLRELSAGARLVGELSRSHHEEGLTMLLKGLNHVAVLTHDATRLNDFYRDVFDAEILRDGSEFPEGEGPRLSIIKIGTGPSSTCSRWRGTPRRTARRRCSAAAASITSRCRRPPSCLRDDPRAAHGPRRGGRLRHRLRPHAQHLLPRPRRPRVRGLRRESRCGPRYPDPRGTRVARYS